MGSLLLKEKEAVACGTLTRRSFLKRTALGAGVAALAVAGYSSLIESNEVDVNSLPLRIAGLAPTFDGFKIALLSDLHFGAYTGEHKIAAAVKAVNHLQPDIVALLGDFVSEPLTGDRKLGARDAEPCAKILGELRSRCGSLGVLGNHDYYTDPEAVADAMRSHEVSMLRNAHRVIEQDGARLWLAGVDDVLFSAHRLEKALNGIPAQETKILLAHEPDFADYSSRYGISAQFSGHSHGGQVRMPGIRPLYLPELGRKYYDGYYRVGGLQLYTNRGIGTTGLPFRFLCPPEVTLLTLRAV